MIVKLVVILKITILHFKFILKNMTMHKNIVGLLLKNFLGLKQIFKKYMNCKPMVLRNTILHFLY